MPHRSLLIPPDFSLEPQPFSPKKVLYKIKHVTPVIL